MLTRHEIDMHPQLAVHAADRQLVHSAIMAALPQDLGHQGPRARAQCLWAFSGPSELVVTTSSPLKIEVLGTLRRSEPVPLASTGDLLEVRAAVACQKTPPSDIPQELRQVLKANKRNYRSRLVVVPEPDRVAWAVRRLARVGLQVAASEVSLSDLAYADLGRRGGGIPYVQLVASGMVSDAEAWNVALAQGLGKGKNFGLGMLRTTVPAAV